MKMLKQSPMKGYVRKLSNLQQLDVHETEVSQKRAFQKLSPELQKIAGEWLPQKWRRMQTKPSSFEAFALMPAAPEPANNLGSCLTGKRCYSIRTTLKLGEAMPGCSRPAEAFLRPPPMSLGVSEVVENHSIVRQHGIKAEDANHLNHDGHFPRLVHDRGDDEKQVCKTKRKGNPIAPPAHGLH